MNCGKCKRVKGRLFVYAAAALSASSVMARADSQATVSATFEAPSNMQGIGLTDAGIINSGTYGVGIYNFAATGYTNANPVDPGADATAVELANGSSLKNELTDTFQAVCIDFTHDISNGESSTWDLDSKLTDVLKATNGVGISTQQSYALGYLFDNDYPASNTLDYNSIANNGNADAAFQLAVWDVLYAVPTAAALAANPTTAQGVAIAAGTANGIAIFSGNGNISEGLGWASTAWTDGTILNTVGVYALISTTGTQDFSTIVYAPQFTATDPVPLPAAAGVGFSMLVGFGGLAAMRKWIFRKNRIA